MPDQAGLPPQPAMPRLRDLLLQCGQTHDREQRAVLLAQIADGLERAADEITQHAGHRARSAADVAGLRGQAGMARFAAELERTTGCDCLTPAS